MTTSAPSAGTALVNELSLTVERREGHNLRCACPACGAGDNLSVDERDGKFVCFSCDEKGNCFDLATLVLSDRAAVMDVLTRLGLRQPKTNTNGRAVADPLAAIAKQKGVEPAWLETYGARRNGRGIVIPGYDPTGRQCSEFTLLSNGGKGKWASGKPAGVFLPRDGDGARLPKAGETWLVVEGPKDAAALHGLGYLAIGTNGTALAAKFARLLMGCEIILVPDRDQPATEGTKKTARVLFGIAASVRVATLPGELKPSKGIDVRDMLRQDGGAELVKQAIADARVMEPPNGAPPKVKETGGADRFRQTDVGNSRRLIARHGDALRFVHAWQRWLIWHGNRWALDEDAEVERRAKDTVRSLFQQAADEPDADRREKLAKWAVASENRTRIRNMIALAESELKVAVTPEQLNADPWLLNVQNGTIDLRTGKLQPHRRDDLLTNICAASYLPAAESECPQWEQALERIFGGDTELISFVQRLVGYAAVGVVHEHVLAFLYGSGSNGKSLFIAVLLYVLGDYAGTVVSELLLVSKDGRHPAERADLYGKRFVACLETAENRRLAEEAVKSLTGGDEIRVRRLYENFWSFRPSHTLILSTNHRPLVNDTGDGIWRRIRTVPFNVRFWNPDRGENGPSELQADKQLV